MEELTILITGVEGIGKHELAKAIHEQLQSSLKKTNIPFVKLVIETSSEIPSSQLQANKYELIVIMIDRMMKCSLNIVKNLKPLGRRFVLGKVVFVCLGGNRQYEQEFQFEALAAHIQEYNSPILYASRQTEDNWATLSLSLVQYLIHVSGLQSGFPSVPSTLQCLKPSIPSHFFN